MSAGKMLKNDAPQQGCHFTPSENYPVSTDKMILRKVSYFQAPISNIKPLSEISLRDIYEIIATDFLKKWTDQVRAGTASKSKVLPYVTFSAVCKKRHMDYLTAYTGLICIDLDKVDTGMKSVLAADKVLDPGLIFISPSGTGLKMVIFVDGATVENHLPLFNAVCHYLFITYGLEADRSGSDICRACFLCRDEDVYLNPAASADLKKLYNFLPPAPLMIEESKPRINGNAYTAAIIRTCTAALDENRPSDELNRHPLVHERALRALFNAGWRQDHRNEDLWVRPGKELKDGISAKYNLSISEGVYFFTCFSSNAFPLKRKGYVDTQLICELEFGGNWQECITQLAHEYL